MTTMKNRPSVAYKNQGSPRHDIDGWPDEDLEYLGACPVCNSEHRELVYNALKDRLFNCPGHWHLYRCLSCAAGYIDPRPSRETIGRAYENYQTHQQEEANGNNLKVAIRNGYLNRKFGYKLSPAVGWGYYAMYLLPPPLRSEWDYFARQLPRPVGNSNRLLDVGSGDGAFLLRAQQAGWKVSGLEFDDNAASCNKQLNLDVWIGDFSKAPYPPESFDVITLNQVIEHVHDPKEFLSQLVTWLKPGGIIWIGTPNFDSRLHSHFKHDWFALHPPHHLILFTRNNLENLLKELGLNPRFMPRGYYETRIIALSKALQSGCITDGEIRERYRSHHNWISGLWSDLRAWMQPGKGSEIVIIGQKPE